VSPFCKPKPKVARLVLGPGISLSEIFANFKPQWVTSMAPRMTVAAVSAPTAASTGEDMSMEAPQVADSENVSPQVVMVTGKPVCAWPDP
jgi:hypothetical protein